MDTKHSSLSIDGMLLHWAECGASSDSNPVPVLLLHGLHDSHLTWRRIAPLLAAGGRRVLMPDLMGCGLSARPDASYALHWHAGLIARWLRELGIKKVDVVGHSFGGGVAQMLLLEPAPPRVRRLALVASGGLGPHVGVWLRLATFPGVVESFGQPFMGAATRLALWRARGFVSQEDIEQLSEMNSGDGSARAFARTIADVINLRGQSKCFFQRAHQVRRLPVMKLFWGDHDDVTPIQDARAFVRSVQNVHLVRFPGAGHYVHHEKAEELASELQAFLDAPALPRARLAKARREQPLWAQRWASFLDLLMPDMSARA
ncbi:MAG TPA: alpha/beta hydrolase [Polyangiales bacterium]|nr:alpha/beta hydrolase [Polyangiales bacterium]